MMIHITVVGSLLLPLDQAVVAEHMVYSTHKLWMNCSAVNAPRSSVYRNISCVTKQESSSRGFPFCVIRAFHGRR